MSLLCDYYVIPLPLRYLYATFTLSSGYLRDKCRSGNYKQKRQLRQLVELPFLESGWYEFILQLSVVPESAAKVLKINDICK